MPYCLLVNRTRMTNLVSGFFTSTKYELRQTVLFADAEFLEYAVEDVFA